MSDFHLLGENRLISPVTGGDQVCSLVVDDVIYAYWRSAADTGIDNTAVIKASTSIDGVNWTTPVTVMTRVGYDCQLGGVSHDGTTFVMAFAEMGEPAGGTVNLQATATNGINFGSITTLPFTEYWACPSDLFYDGTTWWLAATVQLSFDGPFIVTLKSSTNRTTWTSHGYANQLTATSNVHPKLSFDGTAVHLVFREGPYHSFSEDDRILHTTYDGQWRSTVVVVEGTGDPDIAAINGGYAIIYHDQTISRQYGQWSWIFYDGETFVRRGTFSQGFVGGSGGATFAYKDDFAVVYAQRPDTMSTAGELYFRDFVLVIEEPAGSYYPKHGRKPPKSTRLENFDVEISSGTSWYSLADGLRFYMSAEDFGDKAQTLRRITAVSPYYDGTYLVHSTRENVQESLTIGVLGVSQNQVTENILLLEELISQPSFRIRLRMGDHQETWLCQAADYTVQRGHINMHNTRAMMRLMVPRLPAVSYEVI